MGAQGAEDLYELIARCREHGSLLLTSNRDPSDRRPIPSRPADDVANKPPWVQMYVGVWREVPDPGLHSPAAYSLDRYVARVIGVVSRDGSHLAALVSGSSGRMSQMWHDCLHNNPAWEPADASPEKRTWRPKVYVMRNDPAALLERAARDFPGAVPPVET